MPVWTQVGRHTLGGSTVPCRAVPCRAAPGLPCGRGMSGQDHVYHMVTTNPHSLTLGEVSSRFFPALKPSVEQTPPFFTRPTCGECWWARAILQRHPQPSRAQANIVLAAPISIWMNATKIISVIGDVCQCGRTAAGTKVV